jgi:hypothetical protein
LAKNQRESASFPFVSFFFEKKRQHIFLKKIVQTREWGFVFQLNKKTEMAALPTRSTSPAPQTPITVVLKVGSSSVSAQRHPCLSTIVGIVEAVVALRSQGAPCRAHRDSGSQQSHFVAMQLYSF